MPSESQSRLDFGMGHLSASGFTILRGVHLNGTARWWSSRIIFGSSGVFDGFVDALCNVLNGCAAAVGGRARLIGRFRVFVPYP